ncbi:MAG: dGTP triphosphohydrolase, partial [Bacilli bacterium]
MSWSMLLNEQRFDHRSKPKWEPASFTDHRNEFEKDYDRLVISSAVRRLQDKTQVFPLQTNDFTRTRLTHSLEVSAIARSLGQWLEVYLIERKNEDPSILRKISALLATVGLAHDLGNPPFGHFGEHTIQTWFRNWFTELERKSKFPEFYGEDDAWRAEQIVHELHDKMDDFYHFDGNAQNLRIVTQLQLSKMNNGLNLTFGTIGALIKYPWSSKQCTRVGKSKFGYFQQDRMKIERVLESTVLSAGVNANHTRSAYTKDEPFPRNPLVFFLEAADDIAYLGSDLEDAVKKQLIPWERILFEADSPFVRLMHEIDALNSTFMTEKPIKAVRRLEKMQTQFLAFRNAKHPDPSLASVRLVKAWLQSILVAQAKYAFDRHYDAIMSGQCNENSLLKLSPIAARIREAIQGELFRDYLYRDAEVVSLELFADVVLRDLLDYFVGAILSVENFENRHTREEKSVHLISDNFIYVHCYAHSNGKEMKNLSVYDKLLLVTDFISGMTDSYAVRLHQQIKGIAIP